MSKFKKSCTLFYVVLLSLCHYVGAQQISTNNGQSLTDLVQNSLGYGCVEISNVSSAVNGSINSIESYGYFQKENSNFPFENGLILSSGSIASAGNTVITTPLSEGEDNWPSDSDLETALGNGMTVNATSIEFDFMSANNSVEFNYILASEEYFGTNPCNYSDSFVILIKEAGTSDPYTNLALIPGTTLPVNTSNIRQEIFGYCPAENAEFFEGYSIGDTNFNGRTTVLTAQAAINANTTYHIKFAVADNDDQFFDTAVFIQGSSFEASLDLGEDITTCAQTLTIDGSFQNSSAIYSWFKNNNLIAGETNPNLTVAESGTYKVEVAIPFLNSTCTVTDEIEIVLNAEQSAGVMSDFIMCDDPSGDGVDLFDLSTKTDEALAAVPNSNYTISYHISAADASNDANPLPDNYNSISNPQTIYVAIKDIYSGCLAFTTFDLVLISPPEVDAPSPIVVCDEGAPDGRANINLENTTQEILGANPNFSLSYHNSYNKAANGNNPINSPYKTKPFNDVLYIRVTDSETGCSNVTTLNITVLEKPTLNSSITHYINACLSDGSTNATFDLISVTNEILDGLTGVEVSFHKLEADAESGSNPITNPTSYQNTTPNFQTVYMRVIDNAIGCPSVEPIELHTNIFNTGLNLNTSYVCDDASLDGVGDFDLTEVEADIVGDLEGFSLTFYESQADQNSNSNALDKSIPYTVSAAPQEIFVTVSVGSCVGDVSLDLGINPPIDIQFVGDVDYCDKDQDGFTNISLPSFNDFVSQGISSPSVKYYLTEIDALIDENKLGNNFTNTSNPQLLYVRVTNNATSCYDVAPLTVHVHPAPATSDPTPIIICDDDQDGFFEVNLDSKISEIVSNTSNLDISFHQSEADAKNEEAPIINSNNYNATSQIIYTRFTIQATGCYTIVELPVFINTVPIFGNIADFENCEPDGSVVSEFFFNLKDEDVLDGQTGKDVLYFETEQDAIDRVNRIDKFNAYTSISIPQTIYVRVENITDAYCYATSEFDLAIGFLPNFNEPTDLFICDDISNDGFTTIDLNDKVFEISNGITENLNIVFYGSKDNAITQVDPLSLNYTTVSNPQQIFARIDEGESCFSLVDVLVNVIPVPSVDPNYELNQCDVDYDGLVNWDLTDVESLITDVRFSDVDITYHHTYVGAESDTQIIGTPEDFDNTVNPQTLYLKVNNFLSNCAAIVPVKLVVNAPPALKNIDTVEICSSDDSTTILSDFNTEILEQTANVLVSYYASESDARNQINALDDSYTYQSISDTLFARVEFSTTHCFFIKEFTIKVNPTPIANQPMDLEACDDNYDGLLAFNLTQQNAAVLGGASPNDYFIYYYNDLYLAQEGFDHISYNNYPASNNETIYARLENKATGCSAITQFKTFVNPLPFVNIPDQVLCLETIPLLVSANTNIAGDTYLWSTLETTPEIEINEIGSYSVTVTTALGCDVTRSFEVTESEIATIDFTETINFADPNNVTVTVSGIGDYLYQLDNLTPQQSNVFTKVPLGYHTITIIDQNGCGEIQKQIVVMDTPKFMTPNGDGYFDTWHISGVENLPGTVIYIFDRYGKLLKQLSSSSPGWDGSYNGQNMPAADYWFVAKVRQNNEVFELKGHFSLRR